MRLSLTFLIFLLNTSYSAEFIGKVVKLRGDVTILRPHTVDAIKVVQGMNIEEDSSILVNGSGFTKLRLKNKSTLIVGPNSKVVVNLDSKSKTNLLHVLTGKIRAKVKKEDERRKLLIRTKETVLGIRGTEFIVGYNPEAKRTSVLTFDGIVEAKNVGKEKIDPINSITSDKQVVKLKEFFREKGDYAKKGDFINYIPETGKTVKPVKINPKQFVLLKRDESLGAEDLELDDDTLIEINKEIQSTAKEFKREATSRIDKRDQVELGLIDSDSGLYVPPIAKDNKLIGDIDKNGKYIPPKGIKIDAKEGLVAIDEDLNSFVKKVNKKIKKQIPEKPVDPRYQRYFDLDEDDE